jgi:hypothetical protein
MSYNFKHKRGDTFKAVNFQYKLNGTPIDLTAATVRMQLRKECGGLIALNLTSIANDGITITNAASGMFKINKQIINIAEYDYLYDIQITFANNTVESYLDGVFTITCDITR